MFRIALCVGALVCVTVRGQSADEKEKARQQIAYTRSHYTKYEFRIPMRDGVRLFTAVYVPKDTGTSWPILLQRTPYSVAPYGTDNFPRNLGPSELFTREGFIFAYQDVRGRYLSEGTFQDVPVHKTSFAGPADTDESTDTWDTVDWMVKHIPGNNGKVGMWGISYPGFYAAFALINSHPALVAVSPQAPMGDVGNGDDAYHNGAFFLAANFGFYTFFKPRGAPERPKPSLPFDYGTPDAYTFFMEIEPLSKANALYLKNQNPYWNDLLEHPDYDQFWQSRALAPFMKDVHTAVMFVGGWFDAEDLAGPVKLFHSLERNGGSAASDTLVMGPWPHGGWARRDGDELGNLRFDSKTGDYFREHIELPFFLYHLKGKGDGLKASAKAAVPKAVLFETGTKQWRRFDSWPPQDATPRSLYLGAAGALSFSPAAEGGEKFDQYTSDPWRPVPVLGEVGEGMPGAYMTEDQRFASKRTDVLVYQTEPLEQDVTVAGPVTPSLEVSISSTDADFDVKLIDVYPNDYPDPDPNPMHIHMGGYQQLVRGEPFRGKYRHSMTHPAPFTPGEREKIEFAMPDVCHVFRSGHRIMVQVQSSWFPLTDINPQTFVKIPRAQASDFRAAQVRVYRGGTNGSSIGVLTIP